MQTVRDIIYRGEGMNGVTVYGDVLFLINFSMDFLLLFSTSKIMHLRASAKRLLISAALGGAYGVAALFIGNTVLTLVCNAAAAYLLCFLAFPRAGRLILLKCTALFYGLSVLLGGGIVASYLLLSKLGHGIASDSYAYPLMSDIPLGTFLILGAVSMALAYVTGRIFGRQSGKHEVKVKITGAAGAVTLTCLSDSGALAREPLSGSPVIFAELSAVRDCLDPELYSALACADLSKAADGMRLIPCGGVNGSSVLPGFLPLRVEIDGVSRTAVIAVTENTDYGNYDGIVPSSLC